MRNGVNSVDLYMDFNSFFVDHFIFVSFIVFMEIEDYVYRKDFASIA